MYMGRLAATPHKILVIDDHELTCAGLDLLLRNLQSIGDVRFLDRANGAIDHIDQYRPNLLILDMVLPDGSGLAVLQNLREQGFDTPTMFLTGQDRIVDLMKAREYGVNVLVSKGDTSDHLLVGIECALSGDRFLSPRMEEILSEETNNVALSKRQHEILTFLQSGLSNKEISYRLGIAQPTVSFHLTQIRDKLGVKFNREILGKAFALGLLQADSSEIR